MRVRTWRCNERHAKRSADSLARESTASSVPPLHNNQKTCLGTRAQRLRSVSPVRLPCRPDYGSGPLSKEPKVGRHPPATAILSYYFSLGAADDLYAPPV